MTIQPPMIGDAERLKSNVMTVTNGNSAPEGTALPQPPRLPLANAT